MAAAIDHSGIRAQWTLEYPAFGPGGVSSEANVTGVFVVSRRGSIQTFQSIVVPHLRQLMASVHTSGF